MIINNAENVYREGERVYSLPIHLVTLRELSQAYAFALHKWGEGIQSRGVLEAIDAKVKELTKEEEVTTLKEEISTLEGELDILEGKCLELKDELEDALE